MKFTNLGGATAILEHKGIRILFDPWLDEGAFHGAWYHYPPVTFDMKKLGRFDYIYISHIHEDHCSAKTIRTLNMDAEVIFMERNPNFVANFLKTYDFNFKKLHRIPARTPTEIFPGFIVDPIESDPAHELNHLVDSGIVIKWDGFTIYNANDCAPYPSGVEYIKRNYTNLDLALIPYAGGSGYPACYRNLSDTEKTSESKRIFETEILGFIENAKNLSPKKVMPFADQYVIGGTRRYLNKFMSHPASPGAVIPYVEKEGLTERLLLLNSAQTYDLETGNKSPNEEYRTLSIEDKERYMESFPQRQYDFEGYDLYRSVPFATLFELARKRLWAAQKKYDHFPNLTLYYDLETSKKRFKIPLNENTFTEVPWEAPVSEPYLRLAGPDSLFALMLINHISWNIADAALFIDYERKPNIYDHKAYILLNFVRI